MERKLVTLRVVDQIKPIEKADAIELAVFGGWEVVIKKGDFVTGDLALYFEIDSFLPDGNPNWQFLIDKSSRMYNGVKGHKLRTIRLRGALSQGLALDPDLFPEVIAKSGEVLNEEDYDYAELLGVTKWEAPEPNAVLQGLAKGNFPTFLSKSDQTRCQNFVKQIFGYEPTRHVNDLVISINDVKPEVGQDIRAHIGAENFFADFVVTEGFDFSEERVNAWQPANTRPAAADRNRKYEVSLKMDGSSITTFIKVNNQIPPDAFGRFNYTKDDYEFGICSRNLQLKISEENAGNQFIKTTFESDLDIALESWLKKTGRSIAVQGELMGPGIQGNREKFTDFSIYVYNIFDIDKQEYMLPSEREEVFCILQAFAPKLKHCWILHQAVTMDELGITNIQELLKYAEGRSLYNAVREGLVFKDIGSQMSFKAISNAYLLEVKD